MNTDQRCQLTELAEGLSRVPAEKFQMKFWGIGCLDTSTEEFNCGFVGCAIGWAPKLVKGWSLEVMKLPETGELVPDLNNRMGFEAISVYFDISVDDAYGLFSDGKDDSPTAVADRIKTYLGEHQ